MQPERWLCDTAIKAPVPDDWALFLDWAAREHWRVPAREPGLYRDERAGHAFALRSADGESLGMVTAWRHQRHAWIGNLIVSPERRGEGLGRRLFQHAIDSLFVQGVGTFWLTASADGLPLYARCGFRESGRIERWVWRGIGKSAPDVVSGNGDLYALMRADAAAWGHGRAGLLSLLARGGRILTSGSTVALLQAGPELSVLGPWLSSDRCPRSNRIVLGMAIEAFAGAGEIGVDVVGGTPLTALLRAAGFCQTGETVLMVRGAPGMVKFNEIVALASLGSMG